MRIVQILPELNEGGVERGTVDLNRELARRGHESIVISAGGRLVERIEADGGVHRLFDVASKNPLSLPRRVAGLRRLLSEISPDLIHLRSRVPAWLTLLANRRLDLKTVTTVHGFNSVNPYSAVMTRGDRVICVSEAVRNYILEHYDPDPEKIRVVHRGVDTERFDPASVDPGLMRSLLDRFDLKGRIVISTVGRITQLKDLESFIRAIALLSQRRPEIVGLVVGGVRKDKKEYFASLKRLVSELKLEESIRFVGSRREIPEIYRLSDLVVSSSKKPESFGRSVAEAIAMDTPVVATGHGGVLEIVREGIDGYFCPPGDPEALAEAAQKALRLQVRGHEYVRERFSLEKMVQRTLEIYREVLE